MNKTTQQALVASANQASYDSSNNRAYIDSAPHLKHRCLQQLYAELLVRVYNRGLLSNDPPSVLDLGAGEGTVTLPFLTLGAEVTAVDISQAQLRDLREKCYAYQDRLEVRCEDVYDTLRACHRKYDIIVINSFFHHIPDYISFVEMLVPILNPGGQIFSFQDPLRYDTLGTFAGKFNSIAYISWRLFKGDLAGGIKRRIRRSTAGFSEDNPEDALEYHAVRNGVDQEAISRLLESVGFVCEAVKYYSTQSRFFQKLGMMLGMKNTFAIIACKQDA